MGEITKWAYDPNDRDAWLKLRKSLDKVGGSELGIIAGHSKYASPYSLFCEKVGRVDKEDISDKESVIQGHDLEQYVSERFEKASQKKVEVFPYIMTNSSYPWLEATVDRVVVGEKSGLECKTMQSLVMNKFKNGDFPLSYYDQCVTYLAVSELDRWYLAILVFGTAFKVFMMTTRKEEYERYEHLKAKVEGATLLTKEEQEEWASQFGWLETVCYVSQEEMLACNIISTQFMQRVESFRHGNMDAWPLEDLDGSESTKDTLQKVSGTPIHDSVVTFDSQAEYGIQENGEIFINARGSDVIDLVKQRMEITELIDGLNEQKSQLDNRIMAIMKEKEMFNTPLGKVTYKMVAGRRSCSVTAVEKYFASKGESVPQGIITQGKGSRQLKFFGVKA